MPYRHDDPQPVKSGATCPICGHTLPPEALEPGFIIHKAAQIIGGKTSQRKAEASRRNASKPPRPGSRPRGRPRKITQPAQPE